MKYHVTVRVEVSKRWATFAARYVEQRQVEPPVLGNALLQTVILTLSLPATADGRIHTLTLRALPLPRRSYPITVPLGECQRIAEEHPMKLPPRHL